MDDSSNDESTDAMAQMMGFSSFSASSRKRPKHDHSQTAIAQSSSHNSPSTSANALPLGTRPALSPHPHHNAQTNNSHPHTDTRTQTSTDTHGRTSNPARADKGWTNPYTGHSYTPEEMTSWANGVVREDGVRVFFKPGFVEADPWAGLAGSVVGDKVGR